MAKITPRGGRELKVNTGSAFAALGFEDHADLTMRAELMRLASAIIKRRRLSQAEAGKLLNMDQPRISALLNGKIGKFSTGRLIQAMIDLGQDVALTVTPARHRTKGRIGVREASAAGKAESPKAVARRA